MAVAVEVEEALAAKFPVLLPHLDERQRRLYLGSEARSLGHGGIEAVARAAGVSRQMVAAGAACGRVCHRRWAASRSCRCYGKRTAPGGLLGPAGP